MDKPTRQRLRRTRRLVGYGGLSVLILLAVVVGGISQLLPWVEANPKPIADWLTQRVGEPVNFDHAYAEWTRRGPRVTLDGLRVGEGETLLHIGRAELLVAAYTGWLPGQPLTELKVRDLALTFEQDAERRWRVVGLPFKPVPGRDPLDTLAGFGELQVERARLSIRAPALKLAVNVPRVDVRLRVYGDRVVGGLRLWARRGSTPLAATAELQRDTWSGRMWAGGDRLQLAEWTPLIAPSGLRLHAGEGELALWAQIDAQRIQSISVQATLDRVGMTAAQPWLRSPEGPTSPLIALQQVQVAAHWWITDNGWEMHAPNLRFVEQDAGPVHRWDDLRVAGGRHYAVQARRLSLWPASRLLPLRDEFPPRLRQWLYEAAPQGELLDVRIDGDRDGNWRGHGRVQGLGWRGRVDVPGLQGLSGVATFDRRGGVLRLEPADASFEWPQAFKDVLQFRLSGTLGWWKQGEQWHLGTSGLRLRGTDFGASVRAEVAFPLDGSKPRLDIAARLDPATFDSAKQFWVRHKMPPTAVEWLDRALVSGEVQEGRAVVAGDLDDWPFRNKLGRFDARASVRSATIAFNPGWPPAQNLDVDVAFNGPGMELSGRADLLGNAVQLHSGSVEDFKRAYLRLQLSSDSDLQKFQALALASPLQERFGEHLRPVQMAGPAHIDLELGLALGRPKPDDLPRLVDGKLALLGATMADPRWKIDFSGASGMTRFSDKGFATEDLAVLFDGQPAIFNLRIGDRLKSPELALEAELKGVLAGAGLLRRHEALAWIQPHLSGSSDWLLQLSVPQTGGARTTPPSRLRVRSELRGSSLDLPAPIGKAAEEAMALDLLVPLPVEGGNIELALGEELRMRLRMRQQGGIANGVVMLGPGEMPVLPAQGIHVRGTASRLDALGWATFAGGGEGEAAIRDIDVRVLELLMADRRFPETRLSLNRTDANTKVRLQGSALDGNIDIPTGGTRGIQGRFARFHVPAAPAAATPTLAAEVSVVAESEPAPVQALPGETMPAIADNGATPTPAPEAVPGLPARRGSPRPSGMGPLSFIIDDLRLGESRLGKAELQTRPIPGGMRIEKFSTRGPGLDLDASGEWMETASGSESRFQINFTARSLGEMLTTLGMAGLVRDGRTKIKLSGTWPGTPAEFSLANFTGLFNAEVGDGALLDVDPGGGRFLGLVSLAELPRRITLDFSDFFSKGFAFNTMTGDFVFANGVARTDNLRVDGPAAEILVTGRTDLRLQRYDQRIEVLPKTGGVLPVLGALVGGPVGAAAGAAAQAVLQRPLKRAGRTLYRVTGPWKQPEVEVLEKGTPREAPAPTAPTDAPTAEPEAATAAPEVPAPEAATSPPEPEPQ